MYIGLDFETQGLDVKVDAPTEIGLIGFNNKFEELFSQNFIIKSPLTRPQTQEVVEITGITDAIISQGTSEGEVVEAIFQPIKDAEAIFAYNAPFDVSFLMAMIGRHTKEFISVPVVDVMRDIEYHPKYSCKKLSHLAYDHGIIAAPGDLHRAIADVRLMIQLLSKYDLQQVIANAAEPKVTLRIKTSGDFKAGNEYSKSLGFKFISETKTWEKTVRESQVEQTINGSKYPVSRLK